MKKIFTNLPPSVKATLEEHTAGGYLFVRTTTTGDVEQYMSFDNEISYLAILTKTRRLVDLLEQMDHETFYDNMNTNGEYVDDDDDDDDEKEF